MQLVLVGRLAHQEAIQHLLLAQPQLPEMAVAVAEQTIAVVRVAQDQTVILTLLVQVAHLAELFQQTITLVAGLLEEVLSLGAGQRQHL
jgi:hypothetical protein